MAAFVPTKDRLSRSKTTMSSPSYFGIIRAVFCLCLFRGLVTIHHSLEAAKEGIQMDATEPLQASTYNKHNNSGNNEGPLSPKLDCPTMELGNELGSLLEKYKPRETIVLEKAALEEKSRNHNRSNSSNLTATPTRLFIHVGPVKTGSSSIQCNLMVNRFLRESSYEYMGKAELLCEDVQYRWTKGKRLNLQTLVYQYILRGWLGMANSTNPVFEKYVNNFKATFHKKSKQGLHTIISGEEFCGLLELDNDHNNNEDDDRLQQFANLLNSIPQSIIFQVVYRHNFDWALSHYQYFEIKRKSDVTIPKFKRTKQAKAASKLPRSDMGYKAMDSILDHKALFLQNPQAKCNPHTIYKFLQTRLIPLLERGSLQVLNYHVDSNENAKDEDLAKRYICNLPDAQVACNKTRELLHLKPSNPTNVNILHGDRIVTAAWKKGLFGNSNSTASSVWKSKRPKAREMVIDHVLHHLNASFSELPLECLSQDELIRALEVSLSIGQEMLGKNFHVGALVCKFLQDKSRNKFCSINTTAVLEDPSWTHFFETLEIKDTGGRIASK